MITMRILSRIWNKLRLRVLLRKQSAAQKMADDWQREADKLLIALGKKEKLLRKTITKFESQVSVIEVDIEHVEEQVIKHEKVLEALRSENDVMSNITIPALTAACKLGVERWDAETASWVRRQAVMLSPHDKE